ncbi:ABC transporter permease [Flavitalea sp. BT771]|uniref:ABC transporter permease n=1 Tax=Flavitalea sp. BT771 TaxID=3063329 RepID=UPI0026E24DBF|nr:ABC transporter permease [Flavitalea sp. BT771]MDO6433214.1 ABC transporter permease [Flavitalea sp. BT771]MDV6221510.1 ABC transporter permease [Flavitalea sp. BT771]
MLKSYLTIAWRNIIRHKGYAAINVLGIAMGLTCCLFILLWVQDEKSVDNFHRNGKELFAVYQTATASGNVYGTYTTPLRYDSVTHLLLDDVKGNVPEVQYAAFYNAGYILPWGHAETFQVGDKIMKLEGSRAGADFFHMFSFPLIEGSPSSALKDIYSIAISRKMAGLFFGSPHEAMGRMVRFENKINFNIAAVFEDLPSNSQMKFDYLINWDAQRQLHIEFPSNEFHTYVQLKPGADLAKAELNINRHLQTRLGPLDKGTTIRVGLQPVADQYLHSVFVNGKPSAGRIQYVRIFSSVAIFILLIACINFMNLATARSVRRAKEVGLRKVVGSTRAHLLGQFFGESMLFALLAMLTSLLLLFLLLPAFNQFTGKHITLPLSQLTFWTTLLGITLTTGLIAGSYPALYLSSLQPIRTLKGIFRFTQSAIWFRKGLTIFQFVLSIVFLIATIVIVRQTRYVQNTNLGYDRDNLIYIRIEGALSNIDKYQLFKQRASTMPGIQVIDRSTETPHSMDFLTADAINWEGKGPHDQVGFKPASVGFDFVKMMHLTTVQGRPFSRLNATDSSDAFMVNEEAVRRMGMKDPIGKWVSAWKKKGHIIGVLKDYHTGSLHEPIMPVILDVKEFEYFGVIMARAYPGQTPVALASLEKVYKEINPGYAFAYQFVDEEYKKMYASEQIVSRLSILFAFLAIVISCLGLLGLVMFAAEQRVKEIGIRKVLGASLGQIISLFAGDFLQLVTIAFLIAGPLAWYAMNAWLHDFAYRVTLSWWIFALAGASALLIALLTVSHQAMRAATANPVKSLRSE